MIEDHRLRRLEPEIRRRLAPSVDVVFELEADPPSMSLRATGTQLEWLVEEMPAEYLVSTSVLEVDGLLPPNDVDVFRFAENVDRSCTRRVRETFGPIMLGVWWTLGDLPLIYDTWRDPQNTDFSRFGYRRLTTVIGGGMHG